MLPKIIAVIFVVSLAALFVQGYLYFSSPGPEKLTEGVLAQDVHIRSVKNEWRFEPAEVSIAANTAVRLRIFNEDSYQHGFAIRELGIDKALPPRQETIIELANISPGEYEFFCSVLCGRGHFEHRGKLIVR
jgi:cytochrome c oxidase subunit 2